MVIDGIGALRTKKEPDRPGDADVQLLVRNQDRDDLSVGEVCEEIFFCHSRLLCSASGALERLLPGAALPTGSFSFLHLQAELGRSQKKGLIYIPG